MTEEEAKSKWCPFTRLTTPRHNAFNRVAPDDITGNPIISVACCCIASACMAWRWVSDHGPQVGEQHPANQGWDSEGYPKICPEPIYGPREGYCGLAGSQ